MSHLLKGRLLRRSLFKLFLLLAAVQFPSCSNYPLTPIDTLNKQGILAKTNIYLSTGDCANALALIEPLYNSSLVDNTVRIVRASAHGCNAGLNFLATLDNLTTTNIVGNYFWRAMTQFFPYSSDSNIQSSWYATDSLMAMLLPGAVVSTNYSFNSTTVNPASMDVTQRTPDSNLYLAFISMTNIGQIQNKRGAPNSSYVKTTNLPGATVGAVTQEVCAYTGSIVNMIEGLQNASTYMTGPIATKMQAFTSLFDAVIKDACGKGCAGTTGSGCTMTYASCASSCPIKIRYRDGCIDSTLADVSNPAKCAASGIINFINTDTNGWN